MDTAVEAAIHVYKKDGTIMSFKEYKNGLYFYDVTDPTSRNYSTEISAFTFIYSVETNKKDFHCREIEGADQARALYRSSFPKGI
jgi:hypothetical protein